MQRNGNTNFPGRFLTFSRSNVQFGRCNGQGVGMGGYDFIFNKERHLLCETVCWQIGHCCHEPPSQPFGDKLTGKKRPRHQVQLGKLTKDFPNLAATLFHNKK